MGVRQTGNWGRIMIPINDGVSTVNAELSPVASKTIQGKIYADLFFGHSTLKHWNRSKDISIALQGILGEATIEPDTGNDKVKTTAFQVVKDVSTITTVSAATALSITRPAAAKKNWNMVVADVSTGVVSVVVGTDGDDFSDVWAAAGGPPLVAVDKVIIGAIKLSSNVAAPIQGNEIFIQNGAGELIQERADIPTYTMILMEGGVLLTGALQKCHTGAIPRKVYASFYSQTNSLAELAHTTKWDFAGTRATTEMEAQGDLAPEVDISGAMVWSGSFDRFRVGAEMFKLAFNKGTCFVRLFPDRRKTGYYEGAAIITSYSEASEVGNAMKSPLQFKGDGPIEWRES